MTWTSALRADEVKLFSQSVYDINSYHYDNFEIDSLTLYVLNRKFSPGITAGVQGESIHSLSPPWPLPIVVLYCTPTGNLSIREGSQSGELAVIIVYSTRNPRVVFKHGFKPCAGDCGGTLLVIRGDAVLDAGT